ncbi:MAG: sulfotransferase [Bacteroidia bacterium]
MNINQVKNLNLNFILTTARSGSTLLSLMLHSHPNTNIVLEEPFAYNLYPKYKKITKWTSNNIQDYCNDFYLFSEGKLHDRFVTKKEFESLLENHKENLTIDIAIKLTYLCFFPDKDKSAITTIIDKQLLFHSCLEDVASFYPQSKFIILYRDPRDNAFTKWGMYEKKKEFEMMDYYRLAYDWEDTFSKLYDLKTKIGSERFLEVKYEDLVTNPEMELKRICTFLDLTYTPEMLEYDAKVKEAYNLLQEKHKETIVPLQKGIMQKPQTNKIGYWKQNLTAYQANLIWTICGNTAEKIGYKRDEDFIKQNRLILKNFSSNIKIWINKIKVNMYYSALFFIKLAIKKTLYGKNPKRIKSKPKQQMFGNN